MVTEHIRELVLEQIDEHGVVVWFDPERHYEALIQDQAFPDTTIAAYEGSFFALRHRVRALMEPDSPPRLLVYVPLGEERTDDALVELTAAGATLKPRHADHSHNTRLPMVARALLQDVLGEAQAKIVERQVEAGLLSLADLDEIAQRPKCHATGVVSVLFGSDDPKEVALRFLSGDHDDPTVEARGAVPELAGLLGPTFGIDLPIDAGAAGLRSVLAHHVLLTDLVASLGPPLPQELQVIGVATRGPRSDACVDLARAWRLRRDLAPSYVQRANSVEAEVGLSSGLVAGIEQSARCETFACLERALQVMVEIRLASGTGTALSGGRPADGHATEGQDSLLELARQRLSGFWSVNMPTTMARWAVIAAAAEVIIEAGRVERELRNVPADAEAAVLVRAYAGGENPWARLDTAHRHLEQQCSGIDFDLTGRDTALEALVSGACSRYAELSGALAERFLRALLTSGFAVPGIGRQCEVYRSFVAPALREGKTGYLLVDGMRFEMAMELAQCLRGDHEVQLSPAVGTSPGVTEVGMAALMPGAETGLKMALGPSGKLVVTVDGTALKSYGDRAKWIAERAGDSCRGDRARVRVTRSNQPLSWQKRMRADGGNADLIAVFSQEIDLLCESGPDEVARRSMGSLLGDVERAVRTLDGLGCETIVVAADHGYVFAEQPGSDMKLDPPGGRTAMLHQRVWVGRGGSVDTSFLRVSLKELGLCDSGELDVAMPRGLGAFKVKGGSKAYYHGGASLQELVIPVLVVRRPAGRAGVPDQATVGSLAGFSWELAPGSKKITTRFLSVQVVGHAVTLLGQAPRVRIRVEADGDVLSEPVAASYGFVEATGDIELRFRDDSRTVEPDTVTLRITHEPAARTASVVMVDSLSGRELARLDGIDVAIAL